MKILHSLPFDSEAKLPSDRIQMNSCSVNLVDIKKEKPFFNPIVERQAEARTSCNQAPDIIGKEGKGHVITGARQGAGPRGPRTGARRGGTECLMQRVRQGSIPGIREASRERSGRFQYRCLRLFLKQERKTRGWE